MQEAERITQTVKEHTLRYLKVLSFDLDSLRPCHAPTMACLEVWYREA